MTMMKTRMITVTVLLIDSISGSCDGGGGAEEVDRGTKEYGHWNELQVFFTATIPVLEKYLAAKALLTPC